MIVKRIEWVTEGYDLHLIPGAKISPSLLKIYDTDTHFVYASAIEGTDNVDVTFDWRISVRGGVGIDSIATWNMDLDLKKGSLEVSDPLWADPTRLYNSVIEVKVIDKTNPAKPIEHSSAIRVHLHDRLKRSWITPSTLTIRPDGDRICFSILAEFINKISGKDYSIIGDISRHPNIEWKSDEPNFVSVDSDPADPDHNGQLIFHSPTTSVRINAKLPAPYNVTVQPATVFVGKPWSQLADGVKVYPIGESSISQARIDKTVNVLFIPDGFEEDEENDFKLLVGQIVEHPKSNTNLVPYNYFNSAKRLDKKINYWRAFIPSPKEGTNVLNLMNKVPNSMFNTWQGSEDKYAVKPDAAVANVWTIQELIYVVGLPTGNDSEQPVSDTNYHKKIEYWVERFDHKDILFKLGPGDRGPPFNPADILDWKNKVSRPLWENWKNIGGYVIANEVETGLGMARSKRPAVLTAPDDERLLVFHPFRTKREHLDKFLNNLRAPTIQNPIGSIWSTTSITGSPDKGKDVSHVIVVCKGGPSAGTRHPTYETCAFSTHSGLEALLEQKKDPINPSQLLFEFDIKSWGIEFITLDYDHAVASFYHELSHSFGLGDEYGASDVVPENEEHHLDFYPNLQHRKQLVLLGDPKVLVSENIKWKWHRIEEVGILAKIPSQPDPTKPIFHIKLNSNQSKRFHKGDEVFLRQRPLLWAKPLKEIPQLTVKEDPGDIVKAELVSGQLNVNDYPGGSNDHLKDSILYRAKKGSGGTPTELLIHKKILDLINMSHGPLNAPSNQANRDCLTALRAEINRPSGFETMTPNFPPSFHTSKPIALQDLIMGLYEGGKTYHCKVYHPAGSCQMRNKDDATSYCHACRYILVDFIDPLLHPKIDKLYTDSKTYSRI